MVASTGGCHDSREHSIRWQSSGLWPISKERIFKRAGFDLANLPQAAGIPSDAATPPPQPDQYNTILRSLESATPERREKLYKYLKDCYLHKCCSTDLLRHELLELRKKTRVPHCSTSAA